MTRCVVILSRFFVSFGDIFASVSPSPIYLRMQLVGSFCATTESTVQKITLEHGWFAVSLFVVLRPPRRGSLMLASVHVAWWSIRTATHAFRGPAQTAFSYLHPTCLRGGTMQFHCCA